ncbi:unnamed protein product [Arabis nemorensis]|uniref:Uncharacterized protein n=1 Tax=Arabis nemorensis TaxID=586526 RepID=A0A565B4T9_9BRAS|nr:unnamed protein product [Arabis nemorensis]
MGQQLNPQQIQQLQKMKGFQDLKLPSQLKDLKGSVPAGKNQNQKGMKPSMPNAQQMMINAQKNANLGGGSGKNGGGGKNGGKNGGGGQPQDGKNGGGPNAGKKGNGGGGGPMTGGLPAGFHSMGGGGPPNMNMPMGMGGPMGNIPAVQGLPATGPGGAPPGYLQGAGTTTGS